MLVDPVEVNIVRKVLWPEETVEGTVKQKRIGFGGDLINPTTIVVTDKRIIIINRATMGFRQDYQVIPYNAITSVRLEHGIRSSSIYVRVQGFSTEQGNERAGDQEGEIDGLRNNEAEELTDFINKKLETRYDAQAEIETETEQKMEHVDSVPGKFIYCTNCGTKNISTAKFCTSCGKSLSAT
jgi:hypothetical protein